MKLEKSRVTSSDLEIIREIYLSVKKTYPENSYRRNYFLAACSLFFFSSTNEELSYDGLIGIDNSSLDKYSNDFKVLRMHAILHDAAGFVHEVFYTGPKTVRLVTLVEFPFVHLINFLLEC